MAVPESSTVGGFYVHSVSNGRTKVNEVPIPAVIFLLQSHPTYAAMAVAAIKDVGVGKAVSRSAITKYITEKYKLGASSAKTPLRLALKKLVDTKKVVSVKFTLQLGVIRSIWDERA